MPKLIFDEMPLGIDPLQIDLDKDNWAVFDIETNGLLPELQIVHCIVIETNAGIERYSRFDLPIEEGIRRLKDFDILIGHNISGYDLPGLLKLNLYNQQVYICDTRIASKVAYPKPDSKKIADWYVRLSPNKHGQLWDNHSLKAWGCRIGEYKGDFGETTDWQTCTKEMVDYCEQDVRVNTLLFKKLREHHGKMWKPIRKAVKLETECNWFFAVMAIHGFRINAPKAYALAREIEDTITQLKKELPWYRAKVTKKINDNGVKTGLKINCSVMNVNSNGESGDWYWLFKALGKEQPTIRVFDKSTKQYVDKKTASSKVLAELDIPEITPAIDLVAANKAYSTIKKGTKSVLNSYQSSPYQDHRIHTEMNTTGTETYRCNHKCYDAKTEILTEQDGWVLMKDLKPYHKVAAVNDDNTFQYEIPQGYYEYAFDGNLLGVDSMDLDYRVTPNHLMWASKRSNNGWKPYELIPQEDMVSGYGSCFRVKTYATLLESRPPEDGGLCNNVDLDKGRLLGFLLGDGCLVRNRYRIKVKKRRKINYVTTLLMRLGIEFNKSIVDGCVSFTFATNVLPYEIYNELGQKIIEDSVFNNSMSFKFGLWDGLKNSDGHYRRQAVVYSSTSLPLMQSVNRLLSELGQCPSNLVKRNTCYTITARSGRTQPIVNSKQQNSQVKYYPYKGSVYCVTVSTGRLLTRRNGKQLVAGNSPNVNFPKVKKDKDTKKPKLGFAGGWGVEFRGIIEAPDDWVIIGADAKSLEFRMLGHQTYQFDKGGLLDIVLNSCIHQASADLYTQVRKEFGIHEECDRDEGKATSYGYIYGGGSDKLGRMNKGGKALGDVLKDRLSKLWNLTDLLSYLSSWNDKFKHIKSIDNRLIPTKSAHSLLNYLLQSSGSIVCKAVVIKFVKNMLAKGYTYGEDFEVWLFVHDELQAAVKEEYAEKAGEILLESFIQVGNEYKLHCPLEGDLKVGKSWAETH